MKKLLILILLISFPAVSQAEFNPCRPEDEKYTPITERYNKGVFFSIRKCGVRPSYLLGTMHSDDPRITQMLDTVFARLSNASSASFEIKFDQDALQTTMKGMYLPPDSIETLQSIVGISYYNKFVNVMKTLQPENSETTFYRMRPWAAAVMLQEPPNKADGVALDLKLQNFANQRNIPVYGLETAESQMKIFADVPQDKQVEFFKDTIDNYTKISKDNDQMFALYLDQDLNKLQVLGDESFSSISDKDFAAKLKLDLVDNRNRNMVKAMDDKLKSGNAFIAVGALHLTGKNGLLKLLEDAGYYIDVVPDSKNTMMQ